MMTIRRGEKVCFHARVPEDVKETNAFNVSQVIRLYTLRVNTTFGGDDKIKSFD